jgi:selenocysteine-specific elongation factor
VQVHNETVDAAAAGQRVALNLSAQDAVAIERGHVICDESIVATTSRFDAHIRTVTLPREAPLKHQQRVRVHTGTAERIGRIVLIGQDTIGSRAAGYGQIVLTEPVLVMRGDRFILRDETARRTIGGGSVIHPQPPVHRRSDRSLTAWLARMHSGAEGDVIAAIVERSEEVAVPVRMLEDVLDAAIADGTIEGVPGLRLLALDEERLCVTERNWQVIRAQLIDALSRFHETHPLVPGMEMEDARAQVVAQVTPRIFRAIVERFASEGLVSRDGSLLRLPAHSVRLTSGDEALSARLRSLLGETPWSPPDLTQLAAASGAGRDAVLGLLRVMERDRAVVRASSDIYFLREAVENVKIALKARLPARGTVTPAALRDLFQTSRKYVIPLLELLDREGVTIRIGDTRRLR